MSFTEAEYKSLTSATWESIWLRRILEDVATKKEQATRIQCDNQSSIKLAHNPIYHARSKHIELQHHFVREKIESKEIELNFVVQVKMSLVFSPNQLEEFILRILEIKLVV